MTSPPKGQVINRLKSPECGMAKGRLRFGTSGIRGIIGRELSPAFFRKLGSAIGACLPRRSSVCIATDTRVSRNIVKEAVAYGLTLTGIDVIDLGILPTPALACLTREMGFDAGVMVTASHNPPEFNGIKLFNADSRGYTRGQEILIEDAFGARTKAGYRGRLIQETGAGKRYRRFLMKKAASLSLNHNIKLAIDPGNGAAAGLATAFFRRAGFAVYATNDTPDGSFPNRNPEPTAESLAGTIEFLRYSHADLALCFDGDADRIVFCDKEGFLGLNEPIAFISRLVFEKDRQADRRLATTVETGRTVDLALKDLGVEIIRGRVGDANVARLAGEISAPIGVEEAGVYIFPEIGYYPESFYAALTLLGGIKDAGEIRDFFNTRPKLFLKKTKIPCRNTEKGPLMDILNKEIPAFEADSVNTLDGLRFEYEDGWLLIRPSGTEPCIRTSSEATSAAAAEERTNKAVQIIGEIQGRLV